METTIIIAFVALAGAYSLGRHHGRREGIREYTQVIKSISQRDHSHRDDYLYLDDYAGDGLPNIDLLYDVLLDDDGDI